MGQKFINLKLSMNHAYYFNNKLKAYSIT